jgi:formylglycine-generating enzyme required for sulfatase activity
MSVASPAGCARCGTILGGNFRFCPECGLPVSGESVLSTEIAELRRRVEADSTAARSAAWRRYLLPVAATAMSVFVVVLGLVLFNNSLLNRLFPESDPSREGAAMPAAPHWEPVWKEIKHGTFIYGMKTDNRQGQVPYDFLMSKYEVPNSLWFEFITAERRRLVDLRLWQEAFPAHVDGWTMENDVVHLAEKRRNYPVTDVSPIVIAEFCAWLTNRLNRPGWEIRIPTQMEWEYAARGTDGRTYPWGEGDVAITIPRAGGETRSRSGIDSAPFNVDDEQLADDDTSPFGVVAMGVNVSEWTLLVNTGEKSSDAPKWEDVTEIPAVSGLRDAIEQHELLVARRGASHACSRADARRLAQAWRRAPFGPRDAGSDVGDRLLLAAALDVVLLDRTRQLGNGAPVDGALADQTRHLPPPHDLDAVAHVRTVLREADDVFASEAPLLLAHRQSLQAVRPERGRRPLPIRSSRGRLYPSPPAGARARFTGVPHPLGG